MRERECGKIYCWRIGPQEEAVLICFNSDPFQLHTACEVIRSYVYVKEREYVRERQRQSAYVCIYVYVFVCVCVYVYHWRIGQQEDAVSIHFVCILCGRWVVYPHTNESRIHIPDLYRSVMTHPCMWHDSFIRVTWLIRIDLIRMGWLRWVGSLKLQVSFAEYRLFYRALSQKRPMILRSLLIVSTPYKMQSQFVSFVYCVGGGSYVHIRMSRVTHMKESCHVYGCPILQQYTYTHKHTHTHIHTHSLNSCCLYTAWEVGHMSTYEWVMSHISRSHVTYMAALSFNNLHTHTSTHTHAYIHTVSIHVVCILRGRWVMYPRTNESCHTYERITSHIWMSHVTHVKESCHIYGWVVSHIWMSRVTHMKESCHTYRTISSPYCVWDESKKSFTSSKESYILSKEPYMPSKEPCFLSQETYIHQKSPVLYQKRPDLYQKSPTFYQKSPIFCQMMPVFYQKRLCIIHRVRDFVTIEFVTIESPWHCERVRAFVTVESSCICDLKSSWVRDYLCE